MGEERIVEKIGKKRYFDLLGRFCLPYFPYKYMGKNFKY
jgi:hypothetical protein